MHCIFHFGTSWAELVAGLVRIRKIDGYEVRTSFRRKLQPIQNLCDALFVRHFTVILQVVGWPLALDFRLRAGPEIARRPHALLLGKRPEGRSPIPASIGDSLGLIV